MKGKTLNKKISILENTIAAIAGSYCNINLTKNYIIGRIVEPMNQNACVMNAVMELQDNARFTDVVYFWSKGVDDYEKDAYFEFFSISNLLKNYSEGKEHLSHMYWTKTIIGDRMLAEHHIIMYTDDETGDVLSIAYIKNKTEMFYSEYNQRLLKKEKRILKENLKDAHLINQEQIAQLEIERKYLDVLAREYSMVYHVDLNNNLSTLIKVDQDIDLYDLVKDSLRVPKEYYQRILNYSQKYVDRSFQREFREIMKPETIMSKLKNSLKFGFRYCIKSDEPDKKYIEVQVIRINYDMMDGNLLVVLHSIDDITAEAKNQLELRAQLNDERQMNERFMSISRIYYSIYQIDLKADVYEELYVKENAFPLLNKTGKASTELITMCKNFVIAKHREEMIRFFDVSTVGARLKNENSIYSECMTLDGNWHQASFIVVHRDEENMPMKILYTTRIISEEKRQQERLISIAEDAQRENRAKTDFISQISHDIRTPMNSIFGFLEIAEANLDDRDKLEYSLGKIRSSGEFLKELVNDVLDISYMNKGKMKINPTNVDLTSMLEEFVGYVFNAHKNRHLEYKVNIHDILHDNVTVDTLRLKQIYVNLLNNAVNYTPDGGSVSFEVYQEEIPESNSVRVVSVISDTGIGMSEEFMKKMFVPFERETDTRINKVEGYGLGLYIVKLLLKLMNGRIEVKSKLEEGTAFKVILDVPYVDAQSVETKDNEVDYAALCSGMNLLVAEDNELNREVITELLEMNNITCDCAEDGKECAEMLSEAEEDKYDAVLMDMQMPIMNGLESAKFIRSFENLKKKNIPIIAMTANASVDDVNKCFDAGMNRHIPKPVDINQLLNTLAEVCRLKA